MPLNPGQTLQGRYRVEALLGQGGMGAVYKAHDLNLSITVVVKENLIHSEEARRQFGREASILANLRHPNLPRVTDFFFLPDQGQYLVMDYVEGKDLRHIVAEHGPVSEEQALGWIYPVLDALDYLHQQNIIHRDIKPANVKMVSDDTGTSHVALVDFGLAKMYDPTQETTIGARGVTPGYAPPEQYGRGRTDSRSDVYSVGATLYAMLTGEAPPDGLELTIDQAKLTPPRLLNPGISPGIEAAVLKAMSSRPADRFQTIAQLRAALKQPEKAMQDVAEAPPEPSPAGPAQKRAPGPALEPTAVRSDRERRWSAQAVLPETEVHPKPSERREHSRSSIEPRSSGKPEPGALLATAGPPPGPHAVPGAEPKPGLKPAARRSGGRSVSLPRWFWPAVGLAAVLSVAIIIAVVALLSTRGKATDLASNITPALGTGASTAGITIFFASDRAGKTEVFGLRAGEAVQLTHTLGGAESWAPVPEPDGDLLLTSNRDGKREVYRLGRQGLVRVTNTPDRYESWSPFPEPDGDILYTSDRSGKREIYRLSQEGTIQVTATPANAESWDPVAERDGDILFTSNRDGRREIYRLGAEGVVRVTHTAGGESWSPFPEPDGDILFTSDRNGVREIYRFGSDGIVQVTDALDAESWSPHTGVNGYILFTSNRSGKRELYRLSAEGTFQLTNTPGSAESWWER